jgi:hypothetical protein
MKITITNPRLVYIGNGLTTEISLSRLNINQINDNIRKTLLNRSILCDNIIIDTKHTDIRDYYDIKSDLKDKKNEHGK